MQVKTPGGKRYTLTVIDDYSRFSHVYLLDRKSSTKIAFKKYIDLVSNKFNRKPKVIWLDREREYIDKKLIGQSERASAVNHIIFSIIKRYGRREESQLDGYDQLDDAKLLDQYWGETISTANRAESFANESNQ